jgi:hypothetical protein
VSSFLIGPGGTELPNQTRWHARKSSLVNVVLHD